jgi:tRNA(Ile)-lysidine synthase
MLRNWLSGWCSGAPSVPTPGDAVVQIGVIGAGECLSSHDVRPGTLLFEEIGKEVAIEETHRDKFRNLNEPSNVALLDCASLQFPLKMRNFRPGDRFSPLGVKGSQKLKDFFINHKIPRLERSKVPLLISEEKIVWIVGYRIDEGVKITERTRKVLKVEVV